MTIRTEDLLETAIAAARAGGEHAKNNRSRRNEVHEYFKHDIKLQLDLESQAKIEEVIHQRYPDHTVLGEEGDKSGEVGRPRWIIDPIDGTMNFSHGIPFWCCSVAVEVEGQVVAGAVYAPELNEWYTASIDTPALLNGDPISPSKTDSLDRSMILTGLNKQVHAGNLSLTAINTMATRVRKIRMMGAAALDLCFLACGRADGYVETGLYIWDVAAAALIVERAGGRFEVVEKRDDERLRTLASNGLIHEDLRALYNEAVQRAV